MGKPTYFEVMQAVSGHYLCENYPDNFEEMEDEEQTEFMRENAWEPFENWDTDDVASEIVGTTDLVFRFIKQSKK